MDKIVAGVFHYQTGKPCLLLEDTSHYFVHCEPDTEKNIMQQAGIQPALQLSILPPARLFSS